MDIVEKVEFFLNRIEKEDEKINSFITLNENARDEAKKIQKKIDAGKCGRLAGYVLAIKDNINLKGMKCTCASKVLEKYASPYDATVIERIKKEDGLIIGKTNMDQFAAGTSGETSCFGPARNPYDLSRVAGGSSSGSAASVAAGFCDLALGSDTGGSVRCPASFCGVVGIKPTYGLVSRYGLIDLAMSLDQIGTIAKNTSDAILLLSVIAGYDEKDNATVKRAVPNYAKIKNNDLKGMKIGVAEEFFEGCDKGVEKEVRKAIEKLVELGASEVSVKFPNLKYTIPIYYLNVYAEFASAMQKFDGFKYGFRSEDTDLIETVSMNRNLSFGEENKRRILLGTYITMKESRGKWYSTALRARELIKNDFERVLKKCDVVAGPTMPTTAFKLGEKMADPITMYLVDILTVSANLAGIPVATVPVKQAKKNTLPVGLQIHAGAFKEEKIFRVIGVYEAG